VDWAKSPLFSIIEREDEYAEENDLPLKPAVEIKMDTTDYGEIFSEVEC